MTVGRESGEGVATPGGGGGQGPAETGGVATPERSTRSATRCRGRRRPELAVHSAFGDAQLVRLQSDGDDGVVVENGADAPGARTQTGEQGGEQSSGLLSLC